MCLADKNIKMILAVLILICMNSCNTNSVIINVSENFVVKTPTILSMGYAGKIAVEIANGSSDSLILEFAETDGVADLQNFRARISSCILADLHPRGTTDFSITRLDTILPYTIRHFFVYIDLENIPTEACSVSLMTIGYETLKNYRETPFYNDKVYYIIPLIRSKNGEVYVEEPISGYDGILKKESYSKIKSDFVLKYCNECSFF